MVYVAGVIFYAARSDPSSHGEWLVHYGEGFVRRGLLGEAILSTATFSGVDPRVLTVVLQVLAFATLLLVMRRFFLGNWSYGSLALLFTPGAMLYQFVDPSIVGRKESLTLLMAALTLSCASKFPAKRLAWVFLAIGWGVVFLTHESSMAFFPGVLVATFILVKRSESASSDLLKVTPMVTTFLLAVALIYWSASTGDERALCDRILTFNYLPRVCEGGLSYINQGTQDLQSMIVQALQRQDLLFYLGFLALCTAVALYVGSRQGASLGESALTQFTLLVGFGLLSLIASDWGRWLHLYCVISMIVAIVLSRKTAAPNPALAVSAALVFLTLGFSFNGGTFMSPLGNLLNLGYYLGGGMYGGN